VICYLSVIRERPDLREIIGDGRQLERGGIVGRVTLVDCVQESERAGFVGDYGFAPKRPIAFPFTPMRGMLGFFNVSEAMLLPVAVPPTANQMPATAMPSPPVLREPRRMNGGAGEGQAGKRRAPHAVVNGRFSVCANFSRSTRCRILPVAVRGMSASATNTI
jgi:hypothetical protein